MKWLRRKIEDEWNYSLRVDDNLVFQVEPEENRYRIWISVKGFFLPMMFTKKLRTAKEMCEELGLIIEKYRGEENG